MSKPKKYTFDVSKVKRCITHALMSREWCVWSAETTADKNEPLDGPSLLLMEDELGLYVISAGFPRDRLRNKKIYCVYSKEERLNHLAGKWASVVLQPTENTAPERVFWHVTIPLSVGTNGHCYEEYLAEGFEELTITLPTDAVVAFETKRKAAHAYFSNFDENDDSDPLDKAAFNGKRRIQKDSEDVEKPGTTV